MTAKVGGIIGSQHKNREPEVEEAELVVPVVAAILKVAGCPLATGLGDISTPETLTSYSVFLSIFITKIKELYQHPCIPA